MAVLIFGSIVSSHAADVEVYLDGTGSASGEPLAALIEITIDYNDTKIFTMSITNTSPETSSTENGAPVITRVGFDANLAEAEFTLLDASHLWEGTSKTKPFCGSKRALFPYGVNASRPAPQNGVRRGETAVLTLQSSQPLTPEAFDGFVWAIKNQVVGVGGEDSGCAFGNAEIPSNPLAEVVYTLSEFVASGAEVSPLPSNSREQDTRAGSLEINTNGSYGYGGQNQDPAYEAGIVSLRNGGGPIVEQKQINRRWPPALDAEGCNPTRSFAECWFWAADRTITEAGTGTQIVLPGSLDTQSNTLTAAVPDRAGNSNDGFDSVSPQRVTVSGDLTANYNLFTGSDNSHQTITATWDVPQGRVLREETQMLFRGRYDWNCNGLRSPEDPMVPLFYINAADANDNVITDAVTVVEDSSNRLTITVDVQRALELVRDAYAEQGFPLETSCL